jgi:hypothetical protein
MNFLHNTAGALTQVERLVDRLGVALLLALALGLAAAGAVSGLGPVA